MYCKEDPKERRNLIPVAQRKIEFAEEDYLEEGFGGFDPSIMTKEALEELELIHLTQMDESVYQITDSYPIVEYSSTNTPMLNRWVGKVTVSAVSGTKIFFDKDYLPKEEIIEDEVVAYITSQYNASTAIYYADLIKLLCKKPNLIVTPEGVLLFYTTTTVFATLDCNSGNIVDVSELGKAIGFTDIVSISSITVENDMTKIKMLDSAGVYTTGCLYMKLNLLDEIGVTIKITEITG